MTCSNCKFWRPVMGYETGHCHRHAPVVLPIDPWEYKDRTCWPSVKANNACGDFEKKSQLLKDDFSSTAKRFFRYRDKIGKPVLSIEDFLNLSGGDVLSVKTIGLTTWLEMKRKQQEIGSDNGN